MKQITSSKTLNRNQDFFQTKMETLSQYLLPSLNILHCNKLLGLLIPDQPRHGKVPRSQLLQRLIPLLHHR